ncbi:MAG: hypothetical protein E7623_02970 [Ruminococcaceae bacterium]|nr:hypothetical protein [Oscillospiraceae bacterium]
MKKLMLLVLLFALCLSAVSCGSFMSEMPTDSTDGSSFESEAVTEMYTKELSALAGSVLREDLEKAQSRYVFYYYSFDSNIRDLVGEDRFLLWNDGNDPYYGENGEVIFPTLTDLVSDLEIPRAEFEKYYLEWMYSYCVLDFDLLYGDDSSAVRDFFANDDRYDGIIEQRAALESLKRLLNSRFAKTSELKEKFIDKSVRYCSLADLIRDTGVSRDSFESALRLNMEENSPIQIDCEKLFAVASEESTAPSYDKDPIAYLKAKIAEDELYVIPAE